MNALLTRFFNLHENERPRALVMSAYLFLIVCCLLMLKPVRNGLFLERFPVTELPNVFLLVALSAGIFTTLYAQIIRRRRLALTIRATLIFIILNLLMFWAALRLGYQQRWFIYGFYVWVALFGGITTSQFWTLANVVFDAREARRLFGLLAAGGICGGIVGGYAANLATVVGTENLLLICVILLMICLRLTAAAWKFRIRDSRRSRGAPRSAAKPRGLFSGDGSSTYLSYLVGIVGLGVVVANMVDYQFAGLARQHFSGKNELTAFFGTWLSNLSLFSLVFQIFFTSRIVRRRGVIASLLLLPAAILLSSAVLLVFPVLWAAVLVKVSDGSFKQSINKAALELLFLPIPSAIKQRAKAFIDVFIDSLATGLGGLLLLFFSVVVGLTTVELSFPVLGLTLLWLLLVWRIRPHYVEAFRVAIEKRTIDIQEQSVSLEDPAVVENLARYLNSPNERQVLYLLNLIENVENPQLAERIRPLLHYASPEIRTRSIRLLTRHGNTTRQVADEIAEMVNDSDQEVRSEAIGFLVMQAAEREKEDVMRGYLESPDYRVKAAAMMCLARESRKGRNICDAEVFRQVIEQNLQLFGKQKDDDPRREFVKATIARAIGAAGLPQLYPYLQILLNDGSPAVLEAAIRSAGETRSAQFIPVLISFLARSRYRKFAREALANYGESIVDTLQDKIADRDTPIIVRQEMPKTLSLIGTTEAAALLQELLDARETPVARQALKALNTLHRHGGLPRIDRSRIDRHISDAARTYLELAVILQRQQESVNRQLAETGSTEVDDDQRQAHALLCRALAEKKEQSRERIFRLLGLKHVQRDMLNAYLGITSSKRDLRANALEFLDNVLERSVKKILMPILEATTTEQQARLAERLLKKMPPAEDHCLISLLEGEDQWLKVCSLYLIATAGKRSCRRAVGNLLNSEAEVVRETAAFALRRLKERP